MNKYFITIVLMLSALCTSCKEGPAETEKKNLEDPSSLVAEQTGPMLLYDENAVSTMRKMLQETITPTTSAGLSTFMKAVRTGQP